MADTDAIRPSPAAEGPAPPRRPTRVRRRQDESASPAVEPAAPAGDRAGDGVAGAASATPAANAAAVQPAELPVRRKRTRRAAPTEPPASEATGALPPAPAANASTAPAATPTARARRARQRTPVDAPPAEQDALPTELPTAPPPASATTTAPVPAAPAPAPAGPPAPEGPATGPAITEPAASVEPAGTGADTAPRPLVRTARPRRAAAPVVPPEPVVDEAEPPAEARSPGGPALERGASPPRPAAPGTTGRARRGRPGPAGRQARGEPPAGRQPTRRAVAEPERGRRGPIVDPRRRPSMDEQARAARPSRRYPALGTIRELKPNGYGFLEDSAGRRRFFHRSEVVGIRFDQLRTGQKVQFDPSEDVRGLRALQVRPAPTPRPRGGDRRGARLDYEGWTPRPRRAPDEAPRPPWRSSLSPFRGEPPGQPPRRKR